MDSNGTMSQEVHAVEQTQALIKSLYQAKDNLTAAIENERIASNRLRDAQESYDSAEAEGLFAYIMEAQYEQRGPLAKVAATSKAYGIVMDNLRAEIRAQALPHVWEDVLKARAAHDEALIESQKAQAEMGALKKIADLQTAMLQVLAQ